MATWSEARSAASLDRIRSICMALPEVTEEVTWGTDVNFRVRNKIFCFPGDGSTLTIKADKDELAALLDDPRFGPAPYLARGGWVRMDLKLVSPSKVDWTEIRELIHTSYLLIAPKKLGAQIAQ